MTTKYKFQPKTTLTLEEITDLLIGMHIRATEEAYESFGDELQQHFVLDIEPWNPDGEEE